MIYSMGLSRSSIMVEHKYLPESYITFVIRKRAPCSQAPISGETCIYLPSLQHHSRSDFLLTLRYLLKPVSHHRAWNLTTCKLPLLSWLKTPFSSSVQEATLGLHPLNCSRARDTKLHQSHVRSGKRSQNTQTLS